MSRTNKELEFKEAIFRSAANNISELDFIQGKKQLALSKLESIDFPNRSDEDWKYYDFSDILESNFDLEKINHDNDHGLTSQELNQLIDRYVFRETADNLLVTFNGAYSKELSNFNFEQAGISILNFNNQDEIAKDKQAQEIVNQHFSNNIDSDKYFKLINTALMNNGFLLKLEDNFIAQQPLQVLHISDQNNFNQMRSLIYIGNNAQIDIIVTYIGLEGSQYFTNAVIEAYLEDGAKLKLDKIQNESHLSTSLYTFNASLNANSNFEFNSFSFGANSSRDDISVDINGHNAEAKVNGLYVLNRERKSHHKVTVNHNQGHSKSEQIFKGLLQDSSRAEFNGLIEVAEAADKTDANQLNNNLLLSNEAHIDSRPQLNILADDVKCSHGSTVGNLNPEELFYLQSRGLDEVDAKTVLTYSFCQELIDKISAESARNYTANLAFSSLRSQTDDHDKQIISTLADNPKFKQTRYQ